MLAEKMNDNREKRAQIYVTRHKMINFIEHLKIMMWMGLCHLLLHIRFGVLCLMLNIEREGKRICGRLDFKHMYRKCVCH